MAASDAASPGVTGPIQLPPVVGKLHRRIAELVALPRDDYLAGVRACAYKDWWSDARGIERFAAPAGVERLWWYGLCEDLKATIFELDRDCDVKNWASAELNVDHASELLAKMAAPKMARPIQFPPAIEEARTVIESLAVLPHYVGEVGKRACEYEGWPGQATAIENSAPPPLVDDKRWTRGTGELASFIKGLVVSCEEGNLDHAEEYIDTLALILAELAVMLEQQPN